MNKYKINVVWVILVLLLIAAIAQATQLTKNTLIGLGMAPAMANLLGSWTATAGANTACNTTCTKYCVFGFDAGTSALVACDSALADTCICTN